MLPFYPTTDEMIQAAQVAKWDVSEPAAIANSYDPSKGTWTRGNYSFQVVSTSPILVDSFQDGKKISTYTSTINAKINPQHFPFQAEATVNYITDGLQGAAKEVKLLTAKTKLFIVGGVILAGILLYYFLRR